jgi:hypothetical protein
LVLLAANSEYDVERWQRRVYFNGAEAPAAFQFHKLIEDGDALNERHMAALRRMFADRGVDLDSAPWQQIDSILGRLVDEAAQGGMRLPMECLTA